MASAVATKRLRQDYRAMQKAPLENIVACPKESDILEWHYVIRGPKGTDYENGYYHGILRFPPDYPFKPPSIQMNTPNGRFKVETKLCLSMSDFHPETWNPLWSVSTILMGLYSFMLEETPTQGSIVTSRAQRRNYASESLEYNCKHKLFCELFPDYVKMNEDLKTAVLGNTPDVTEAQVSTPHAASEADVDASWYQIAGVVGVLGVTMYIIISAIS